MITPSFSSKIPFSKYHGSGNDFILIDDRSLFFPVDQKDLIISMCNRTLGIGADGVILWQPSHVADMRMRIFNADGSEAAMCGNGIRCLVDFIHQSDCKADQYQIETGAGSILCQKDENRIGIYLGSPTIQLINQPLLIDQALWNIHVLNTGVPHGVVFVDHLDKIDFEPIARQIRHHPLFASDGINVNFVQLTSPSSLLIRTYERGVEGETSSCGTGAAAASWMAFHLFSIENCIDVHPFKSSYSSQVCLNASCEIELWGDACLVFSGLFNLAELSVFG